MKKLISLAAIGMIVFSLAACGNSETKSSDKSNEKTTASAKTVKKEDLAKLYTDADKFKNYKVDLYVKVFDVDQDEDGTYLQGYADPEKSSKNTLIMSSNPNLKIKDDDIIHVVGKVKDKYEGKNALGGTVTAPRIVADKIEKSDYATAFAPAEKTIKLNKTENHNGYAMTLQKVELAQSQTRIYISIENKSKDQINFYDFNSKITAANKQLEPDSDIEGNYPKIQSEILPGVKTEGVIVFPKLEGQKANIILEGSSENYDLTIDPFTFEIPLN
ncbi:DUF4352 domain-containing protein [Bacillus amyloliquefaciens]|uniref:DUF4352 domain-containing protein n=1 Tax=Bacillus amyloliquefaciens TaxID=1390 RepID=UPI000F62E1D5|nr:DUF4352 domain-containing protein [Bacillus amyloliquefaciens]QBG58375.1 hypothetical protein D2M30_4076 [Bacillus amyloliquefaciens]